MCGKAARTVLCGGRAMKRTTATTQGVHYGARRRGVVYWGAGAAKRAPPTRRTADRRDPTDPHIQERLAGFRSAMSRFGWAEGRNLRTELRFGTGDTERMRASAEELLNLAPEIVVVTSSRAAMLHADEVIE
jgi:hypothetical protein